MPDCPKLAKCPFFNDQMATMPSLSDIFKKQFCKRDNTGCARFIVGSAGKEIPKDLFPNDKARAQQIVNA